MTDRAASDRNGPGKRRRVVAVAAIAVLAAASAGLIIWQTTTTPDHSATGNEPTVSPPAPPEGAAAPAAAAGETYPQVCMVRAGCPVFNDPHTPNQPHHERINFGQEIEVSCKVYAPSMPSVEWWYLLASEPYNNEWSAPAINFLNGDPIDGPYVTDVDQAIPDC